MTPRPPQTPEERAALARYWTARTVFENVLKQTPPELLGFEDDWYNLELHLADIALPGLERPRLRIVQPTG